MQCHQDDWFEEYRQVVDHYLDITNIRINKSCCIGWLPRSICFYYTDNLA